jgi:NAD(P)-dependent dehydrogenase (short-subunit alcohol dehydrogenase family)
VVTGGAQGVGCALATRLAQDGAAVVLADIEAAAESAQSAVAAGHRARGRRGRHLSRRPRAVVAEARDALAASTSW